MAAWKILSTSLHSASSGIESGARCAITEGPRPVRINQCLSTYVLSNKHQSMNTAYS